MGRTVTLIPGDGIGLEISQAVVAIVEASGAAIEWDVQQLDPENERRLDRPVSNRVIRSIEQTKVALKGPLGTPNIEGAVSPNVFMRKHFDTFANVRPARSFTGVRALAKNVNLVVIRENLEGSYAGLEFARGDSKTEVLRRSVGALMRREIPEDAAATVKLITVSESLRIARYAFEYAVREGRRKVTVVHKANINTETDGIFLEAAETIAQDFPDIEFEELKIDDVSSRLVLAHEKFDMLLCINEHGDYLSGLTSGLVGGNGLVGTANIGDEYAIFEAVHGTAPDIAGQNIANPTAMILSAAMMLKHIGEDERGDEVEQAVREVIREGKYLTGDIFYKPTGFLDFISRLWRRPKPVSTTEFGDAVIEKLESY